MSKKKYALIVLIVAALATTFIYSYNWAMRKFSSSEYNTTKKTSTSASDIDKLTAALNVNDAIPSDAKIILKTQYKKNGSVMGEAINNEGKASDYIGKSRNELEKQGYIVLETSKNQFTITKVINSYVPGKFVLGVKDQYYAIFRVNDSCEMILVEETNIKVPNEREYNNLVSGSSEYQCDSKEDAEVKIGDGI